MVEQRLHMFTTCNISIAKCSVSYTPTQVIDLFTLLKHIKRQSDNTYTDPYISTRFQPRTHACICNLFIFCRLSPCSSIFKSSHYSQRYDGCVFEFIYIYTVYIYISKYRRSTERIINKKAVVYQHLSILHLWGYVQRVYLVTISVCFVC